MHTQIAIIGGGIIGAVTAVGLLQAGFGARLIDSRQIMQESSGAAGGILQAVTSGSKEKQPVDHQSYKRYLELQTTIGAIAHQPWLQTGKLIQCQSNASLTDGAYSLQAAEPVIGSINPARLRPVMRDYLAQFDALQEHHRVSQLHIDRNRVTAITIQSATDHQSARLSVDHVILACGYQVDTLLAANDLPLTGIQPIKGQMLAYKSPGILMQLGLNSGDVVFTPECYVICRDPDTVIVGSTEETVFTSKSTTTAAFRQLHNYATVLLSNGLPAATHQWTGVRPFAPQPYNQIWGGLDNLWLSGGHYKLGLCNAPMYAEQLIHQIKTQF